jgi:hypothetical protein
MASIRTEVPVADTEQPLLSFGPFGVSVCDGPYGIFKWQKKNVTIIELTDRCIRGVDNRGLGWLFRFRSWGTDSSFEIPYAAIVSVQVQPHPARLGLMQVLDVKYRDGEQVREKAIASYNGRIQSAYAILQYHAPS